MTCCVKQLLIALNLNLIYLNKCCYFWRYIGIAFCNRNRLILLSRIFEWAKNSKGFPFWKFLRQKDLQPLISDPFKKLKVDASYIFIELSSEIHWLARSSALMKFPTIDHLRESLLFTARTLRQIGKTNDVMKFNVIIRGIRRLIPTI